MKKTFVLAALGCLLCASVSAQIKTYSSNDCNLDGQVNISDVNSVISEMCGVSSGKQMVSADSLCVLLNAINSRLAAIEKKLGIDDTTVTPTPDPEPTPSDTHEYVDLGLPSGTLWATCNVGANSPEDYGLYFAWGETTGYTSDTSDGHSFDWESYKWCNGSYTTMIKYCTSSSYGTVDNKAELEAVDDAATANWGCNWQMPSLDQIKELCNSSNTTTTWTTENGVYGRKITSKSNGNSIFFPAAGRMDGKGNGIAGSSGYYWSSSLNSNYSNGAYRLIFSKNDFEWDYDSRYTGRSIRPVRVQN